MHDETTATTTDEEVAVYFFSYPRLRCQEDLKTQSPGPISPSWRGSTRLSFKLLGNRFLIIR